MMENETKYILDGFTLQPFKKSKVVYKLICQCICIPASMDFCYRLPFLGFLRSLILHNQFTHAGVIARDERMTNMGQQERSIVHHCHGGGCNGTMAQIINEDKQINRKIKIYCL